MLSKVLFAVKHFVNICLDKLQTHKLSPYHSLTSMMEPIPAGMSTSRLVCSSNK